MLNPLKLWQENKWLFFLLLPLVLIVLFKDILIGFLSSSGQNIVEDTEQTDEELLAKQNKINQQAKDSETNGEIHEAKADVYEDERENVTSPSVNGDWWKDESIMRDKE
jgi:hypothetical protein